MEMGRQCLCLVCLRALSPCPRVALTLSSLSFNAFPRSFSSEYICLCVEQLDLERNIEHERAGQRKREKRDRGEKSLQKNMFTLS